MHNISTPRKANKTPEPGIQSSNRSSLRNHSRMSIYANFVYIFAALAESDMDHEYLYALRLLRKTLKMIPLADEDNRKMINNVYRL